MSYALYIFHIGEKVSREKFKHGIILKFQILKTIYYVVDIFHVSYIKSLSLSLKQTKIPNL